MKNINLPALLTALLIQALCVASTQAAGVHVEIVGFSQPGANGAGYWQDTRIMPPCHAVALRDGSGAESAFNGDSGCVRVPGYDAAYGGFAAAGANALPAAAGKLKAGGHTLLLSRGWNQASTALAPVLLRGGRVAGGRQELEGTVTLGGTDKAPEISLEFTLTRMDGDKPQYTVLKETRKLKPGELNYFDHPLFGLVLQVSAVN